MSENDHLATAMTCQENRPSDSSVTSNGEAHSPELQAPPISAFPRFPASWYRFCDDGDLARGPFAREVCGRRLVAYRDDRGAAVVMDATCSHLGADLGRGQVVDNCVRCPYHHWSFGQDGRCQNIPGVQSIPDFARQQVFPATQRHGSVYFFNGPQATFPLPFVLEESPEDYCTIRPSSFVTNCSWFMATAHAFDEKHFETVHGRRLLEPIVVDTPHPMARRCRYRAEILPDKFSDRVLRRIASPEVEISITVWGGTFTVVSGDFGSRRSRFFLVTEPIDARQTRCDVVVFSPKQRGRLLGKLIEPIALRIRSRLTAAYLHGETEALGGPKYNQIGLTDIDRQLVGFFNWAAEIGNQNS